MLYRSVITLLLAVAVVDQSEPVFSADPQSGKAEVAARQQIVDSESVADLRRFLGVGSCAAANCHGGGGQNGTAGSEASLWIQQDRHAEAYTVLFNSRSQQMAQLLKLDTPAHEAKLCLNCHAPQSDSPDSDAVSSHSVLTDGVSCEACHGAASQWLGPHVQHDWKHKSPEMKAKLGFRNTRHLWTRSKLCADCHVGEAGRDVNHDLYAAGHPRLFFEMSAFNANMPAHWDRNKDRHPDAAGLDPVSGLKSASERGSAPNSGSVPNRGSTFEATLWAVGTLASAEAALELLIHRAEEARDDNSVLNSEGKYSADRTVPVWPEFAETGCFACHHDLQSPSWRQARSYPGRRPGDYPWGTWLFPLAPTVAKEMAGIDLSQEDGALANLTRQMGSPYPDRQKVIASASSLRAEIEAAGMRVSSASPDADRLKALLSLLARRGRQLTPQNWDAATQSYLGIVAVHQGYRDASGQLVGAPSPDARRINVALKQIREQLEFHPEYESPVTFGKTPVEVIVSELDQVIEALK